MYTHLSLLFLLVVLIFLPYVISLFILGNFLCFDVYFIWHYCTRSRLLFFSFYMVYLFHLFYFNLLVSLYLRWGSYKQHTVGSCFLIHSDNLYLWKLVCLNHVHFNAVFDMLEFSQLFYLLSVCFLYFHSCFPFPTFLGGYLNIFFSIPIFIYLFCSEIFQLLLCYWFLI